jgi:DNA-binding transcriptional regulator LsrR (DeoR family)
MGAYTEEELLIIANLYYVEGMTQEEVAAELRISRVTVTRMLRKARDDGLVQINVKKPMPELYSLALALERRYRLKAAVVAPARADAMERKEAVGMAGAALLDKLITKGCRIGVAWSTTVNAILPYVRKPGVRPERINELAGTYLAPDMPYGVSWMLAQKLGVPVESIPMPVLVRSGRVKDMMIREPSIRLALEHAATVDIAVVGLGTIARDSSLMRTGYIQEEQLQELEAKGAVGDILMRYYDTVGNYIPMSFEDQTVSLEWESIKRLPMVVAIAFGHGKIDAIRGALAGGIIKALVTDRPTAETLLGYWERV